MSRPTEQELDERLERLEQRLPKRLGSVASWVRRPSSRMVRLPVGVALAAGGAVGFAPIVGFWMLPVGLALIAKDVPPLRRPMIGFLDWVERKLPAKAACPAEAECKVLAKNER